MSSAIYKCECCGRVFEASADLVSARAAFEEKFPGFDFETEASVTCGPCEQIVLDYIRKVTGKAMDEAISKADYANVRRLDESD